MTNEKTMVAVTAAQHRLLQLLKSVEGKEILTGLKKIHYLGTYCIDEDMVELKHSSYVQLLIEAMDAL